jgi:hypothetical protein
MVECHKSGWDDRYVSSVRYMNLNHVLLRNIDFLYVYANSDDIMLMIRSCWRIQICV